MEVSGWQICGADLLFLYLSLGSPNGRSMSLGLGDWEGCGGWSKWVVGGAEGCHLGG